MANSNSKYLILSFDGGGIRGLVTAMILQAINNQFPNFLAVPSYSRALRRAALSQ